MAKVHLRSRLIGGAVCTRRRTPTTEAWSKVTCRACMRRMIAVYTHQRAYWQELLTEQEARDG